jgi:hypothetical protein
VASNEIGDLKFKVDADTAAASAKIDSLKSQTEGKGVSDLKGFGSAAEMNAYAEEAAKAKQATESVGASAEQNLGEDGLLGKMRSLRREQLSQITLFSRMVGQISAVGAVATTFFKIGEAISTYVIDRFATAKEKAQEFREAVDTGDLTKGLKSYGDKLIDLNDKIYKLKEEQANGGNRHVQQNLKLAIESAEKERNEYTKTYQSIAIGEQNRKRTFATLAKMREDDKAAEKKAEEEKKEAEAKKKAAEEKKQEEAKNAVGKIASLQKKAAYDVMTEEQKIDADAQAAREELYETQNKMSVEDRLANEDDLTQALQDINEKQYQAFAKIADERNKHIEEINKKMEESAKRTSDAWVSSFRSIREASNSVFNVDQAASMVQLAQQMQVSATTAHANMNRIVVEGVG